MTRPCFPEWEQSRYYAPWWRVALARIFGKKVVAVGCEWTLYAAKWRGVIYVYREKKTEWKNRARFGRPPFIMDEICEYPLEGE